MDGRTEEEKEEEECSTNLRPIQKTRQHLCGLVAVIINSLLSQDNERGLFIRSDLCKDLGDCEWLQRCVLGAFDEHLPSRVHERRETVSADADLSTDERSTSTVGTLHAGSFGVCVCDQVERKRE